MVEKLIKPYLKADKIFILAILIIFLIFVVVWGTLSKIETGAAAPGQLEVLGKKKLVQSEVGGTIEKVFVKDGDIVHTGELLIQLDNTKERANLILYNDQEAQLLLIKLRLEGALSGIKVLKAPPWLNTEPSSSGISLNKNKQFFTLQQNLLEKELKNYQAEVAKLKFQIEQIKSQRESYKIQLEAAIVQEKLINEELESVTILEEKKLVRKPRLLALQREASKREADREAIVSKQIELENQQLEVESSLTALKMKRHKEFLEHLTDTETKLSELAQNIISTKKIYKDKEITAPASGSVDKLLYHTRQEVVKPGEVIMEIIPSHDLYIVEAYVNPTDIDRVSPGMEARISFVAFNPEEYTPVKGVVESVSPDLYRNKNEKSYYLVRLRLKEKPVFGYDKLVQGMPVEVTIISESQSPLMYILSPIIQSYRRAFHE